MRLVIDTSVLIDHLRGDERAARLLREAVQAGHELWSATVVRVEILAGMRRGEERATHALLSAIRWQELSSEIADLAGDLARRFMKSHRGVDTVDYVIAGTAQALDATLKTQNVKHFPMIKDLQPAYD